MRWIHFFLLAVVFIFTAQFGHYLITGATYKFKNPLTPSLLAVLLAGLSTMIHSYFFKIGSYR